MAGIFKMCILCMCLLCGVQGQEVELQVDDMWQDLEYQPGDTLNLLDPVWLDDTQAAGWASVNGQGQGQGQAPAGYAGPRRARVCAQKGMIILHPDILLSGKEWLDVVPC